MFLENPVLQRELLVNLRMARGFFLLLVYQVALALVVYVAWPQTTHLDLTSSESSEKTRRLVDLFFIGQYVLASMMTPSFTAGSITGEKERKTYEMLLASPLLPSSIVMGKLSAGLAHLSVLIFSSLPIAMICLPLGGVSIYELLAAYVALAVSVVTFGMISIGASAFFQRTSAALVVSYLIILPLSIGGVIFWLQMSGPTFAGVRLVLIVTLLPLVAAIVSGIIYWKTCNLLLYPPDVGAEGKDVVDLEHESQQAVGLVIQRDQFPDKLFAPPKREDLMEDDVNPVYEKEVRSEIFSQGTLMLRLVIQISMVLAIPFLGVCLYIFPQYAAWYICYVIIFNVLVGPVFSAGSVTSERERETLDLLLTTIISPMQILSGKLIAGLRVSSVLTLFLVWPVLLASILVPVFWQNPLSVVAYLVIILCTCVTTAMLALFCSVLFQKTSTSLMTTYTIIIAMFCAPVAANFFARTFFAGTRAQQIVEMTGFLSPFSSSFAVPLDASTGEVNALADLQKVGNWWMVFGFYGYSIVLNSLLLIVMIWLFNTRWRVAAQKPSAVVVADPAISVP